MKIETRKWCQTKWLVKSIWKICTGYPKSFATSNISRFLSFPLPCITLDRFHYGSLVGQYALGPRRCFASPRAISEGAQVSEIFNRKHRCAEKCHTDRDEPRACYRIDQGGNTWLVTWLLDLVTRRFNGSATTVDY